MLCELVDNIESNVISLADSLDEINGYYYEQGWTDGLPIVPPTAERVSEMLSGISWRDPDELIGAIPPAMGRGTLKNIAVNAVIATNVVQQAVTVEKLHRPADRNYH